ncbi:hypothetical protein RDI58_017831 [Solanum bulbocastanum]|uniref:Phospholipase A(2) n=1 Tax=Solanum bulbocastanum TaxID=147425 RepID=A0AAN8YAC5_SOLBU
MGRLIIHPNHIPLLLHCGIRQQFSGNSYFFLFHSCIFLFSFTNPSIFSYKCQVRYSKTCVAENCNSIGIRYGKYCGVGWSGCPGEKPCDDLDACCKIHDECVEKNDGSYEPYAIGQAVDYACKLQNSADFRRFLHFPGMTNVKCHKKFKRCIKKVQKSGKVRFTRDCPYDVGVPTMVQEVYFVLAPKM